MNPSRKQEFLVGLFLLFGLLMVGVIVLQFGRVQEAFRDTYRLKVTFPNAPGIKNSSPIYLGGSRIGRVHGNPLLKKDSSGVIVELEIYQDKLIPIDATFNVGTVGLMGDALIDIKIKETGQPITEFYSFNHKEIIVGSSASGLAGLQDSAESVAAKVDKAIDDLRAVLVDVQAVAKRVNEETLTEHVAQDFRSSMEHLKNTMTRVDEQVLGAQNTETLTSAINSVNEAAENFKKAAANLEGSSTKIDSLIEKLDSPVAKLDKVMDNANQTLDSIRKGADDFAGVARSIRTGPGLMAALLSDPELKSEFSDLISNLKRRGFVFYRDVSGREEPDPEAQRSGATPEARRQLFRRP
jgi:phospholipid/cholesterol/gamma-HCH transport system substrate-binding protein